MTYAVIRVRGTINASRDIKDTLRFLRLSRVNHCVIVPKDSTYLGMLKKAKDYITWGEIDVNTLARLIITRGRLIGGTKVSDKYIKSHTKYTSVLSFSKGIMKNEVKYSELKDVQPLFRLGPPKKGYEGVKRSFSSGGALGYRGKAINDLIHRMLMEEVHGKNK